MKCSKTDLIFSVVLLSIILTAMVSHTPIVQASVNDPDEQQGRASSFVLPDWGTWHAWTFEDGSSLNFRWSEGGQLSVLVGKEQIKIATTMWWPKERAEDGSEIIVFEAPLERMLVGASEPRSVLGTIQATPGFLEIEFEIVTYEEGEDGEFLPIKIQNGEQMAHWSPSLVILMKKKCKCSLASLGDCTAHHCNQGKKCQSQPSGYKKRCVWKNKISVYVPGGDGEDFNSE